LPDLTNNFALSHIIRSKVTSKLFYVAPRFSAVFRPLATTLNKKNLVYNIMLYKFKIRFIIILPPTSMLAT